MAKELVTIRDGETVDSDLQQAEEFAGYTTRNDVPSGTLEYKGWALPGTATSASSWRIKKSSFVGTVFSEEWADGDIEFDNVWDNRASLSYS